MQNEEDVEEDRNSAADDGNEIGQTLAAGNREG